MEDMELPPGWLNAEFRFGVRAVQMPDSSLRKIDDFALEVSGFRVWLGEEKVWAVALIDVADSRCDMVRAGDWVVMMPHAQRGAVPLDYLVVPADQFAERFRMADDE